MNFENNLLGIDKIKILKNKQWDYAVANGFKCYLTFCGKGIKKGSTRY